MYMYIHICMYIYIHIYMCVCVCTYTYLQINRERERERERQRGVYLYASPFVAFPLLLLCLPLSRREDARLVLTKVGNQHLAGLGLGLTPRVYPPVSSYMLGGWVNPHREQQTIPQGQTSKPAQIFPHANVTRASSTDSTRSTHFTLTQRHR